MLNVPSRVPAIEVKKVALSAPGDTISFNLYAGKTTIQAADGTGVAVTYNSPLLKASVNGKTYDTTLVSPAMILTASVFRIKLQNTLPWQTPCEYGCTVDGNSNACQLCVDATQAGLPGNRQTSTNPLGAVGGPHDLTATNMHLHGLKTDVGVTDLWNPDPCVQSYRMNPDGSGISGSSKSIECQLYGDNIMAKVLPGMTATYTHFLQPQSPGIHWYHPHRHGSVATQAPTASGPIIVPDFSPCQLFAPIGTGKFKDAQGLESWKDVESGTIDPGSLMTQFKGWKDGFPKQASCSAANAKAYAGIPSDSVKKCQRFQDVMDKFPNTADSTKAEIIHFAGLWFQTNNDGSPSDDTQAFLSCQAQPPSNMICPKGFTKLNPGDTDPSVYNLENYENKKGVDFVAVNGVVQPTLELRTGKLKRWMMMSSLSKKWLDITIREMPDPTTGKVGKPVDGCSIWLLAKDGVYLEKLPRLIKSTGPQGSGVSNVFLGPANRADVFVKCNKPGQYVLVSGAGPFETSDFCLATHCELFGNANKNGKTAGLADATSTTGNNVWRFDNGTVTETDAAVLALIQVSGPASGADADLENDMCRTRLELFQHTDVASFPSQTQNQCINFVNSDAGAACNVNGVEFGGVDKTGGLACMNQGYKQGWTYRGTRFHPYHLHDTPVRLEKLPVSGCLTDISKFNTNTNWFQEGDWMDTAFFPMCNCNTVGCEAAETRFKASVFPPVPSNFATTDKKELVAMASQFLKAHAQLQDQGPADAYYAGCSGIKRQLRAACPAPKPCQPRYAVSHCHMLSHEDEGCMNVVWWNCMDHPSADMTQPSLTAANLSSCKTLNGQPYDQVCANEVI